MYTSACIEELRILGTLSHTDSKYGSRSNSWNYEDHAFDYQLDQWGVEKLLQNSDEAITTELKVYIKDWKNRISRTRANFNVPHFLQNVVAWISIRLMGC